MTVKKKLAVIQALLFFVFIICAAFIAKYFYDAHKANAGFDELRNEITSEENDNNGATEEKRADNGMLESYFGLYSRNSDFAGWISVPDTRIDYPVMRCGDNEYYLHRNFDREYQFAGIPFLDCQSVDNSLNSLIYAHNMKDGSMFAAIARYEDKDFYNSHKIIKFDSLYERGEYEIIAAFSTKVGSKNEFMYHLYADIEDETRFNEYVAKSKELSFYDTGVNAEWGDRLLTLSTCAYHTSNERFVVVARRKEA